MADDLEALLSTGGDRRSIGGANAAAWAVLAQDGAFEQLWSLLSNPDPLLRMRAADAAEKVSRTRPDLFQPHKDALLAGRWEDGTPELRWHLLPIAARLRLEPDEASTLLDQLERSVRTDPSRIVRAEALTAALQLARDHRALCGRVQALLDEASRSPIKSLAARARALTRGAASFGP